MCRCCQNCWEDLYWNCFEERFCYDESIANYNPDDDEAYIAASMKQDGPLDIAANNNLRVPPTICSQPTRNGTLSNGMIREDDYRRETQTNVPMLGPEILNVFVNSQIFQEHPHTKQNRLSTKPFVTTPDATVAPTHGMMSNILTDQQNKFRQYEATHDDGNVGGVGVHVGVAAAVAVDDPAKLSDPYAKDCVDVATPYDNKNIKFALGDLSSSSSISQSTSTLSTKAFEPIKEENCDMISTSSAVTQRDIDANEVILRPPRLPSHRHQHHHHPHLHSTAAGVIANKQLRAVNSFSYFNFNVRTAASDTDIFTISGTNASISMTPEVPSISYTNLPKNYEDTPTIEKYRVSRSLYSIQADNEARASKDDFSMPRYFRRSGVPTQIRTPTNEPSPLAMTGAMKESKPVRVADKDPSKRLKMIRGNLPPLLIHSVSFSRKQNN